MTITRKLDYLWQRHVLRRKQMLADGLPLNMRFRFYAADDVGRHLFKYRVYEPPVFQWLKDMEEPEEPALVFDIGANLGWYSVLANRLWGQKASIHCFEPDPRNRSLLKQNLALNRVADAVVVAEALADQAGHGQLNRYRGLNLGKHSLLPLQGAVDAIPTPINSLDAYTREHGLEYQEVALIKLDVEGMEPAVVDGGRKTLQRTALLMMEYSPMYYQPNQATKMVEVLEQAGLHLYLYGSQGWQPAPAEQLLASSRQLDTLWSRTQDST